MNEGKAMDMKRALLASTILAASATIAMAQTPGIQSATILPGGGTVTEDGHVWTITESGSIMEDGQYTPGGGGTSALMIVGVTVYGQDSGHGPVNPGGWFTLNDGQYWTPNPAPPGAPISAATAPDAPQVAAATAAHAAAPAPTGVCGSVAPSGSFHVAGGQIIGPDGKPFIARGVNVYDELANQDANAIFAMFPGVNFIRIGMHSYSDPSTWDGLAQQAAARGTVLEFENHPDGGGGQDSGPPGGIGTESAWYAAMASHFKNNPYVWFGTFNEPNGIAKLSDWQKATYDAVRGAGNTNPVMVYSTNEQGVLQPGVYAGMTNIIWDVHFYGGSMGNNTDQMLAASIATSQSIQSADGLVPAIIGEYGDSMDGTNIDNNWQQAVTSVINLGSSGKTGSAAWAFDPGGNGDRVQNGGLTTYGQMVALYINTSVQPCSVAEATANANTTLAAVTAQITGVPQAATTPATSAATAPVADTTVDAMNQSADASIAQANAIIAQAQAASATSQ
jgi:hypothetical protein